MKYVFFGELYHDTIIEANSLDEAYEIIVEKYYEDCVCSGSITSVDGTKIIEISAWGRYFLTTKRNVYPMNVVLCSFVLKQIIILYLNVS